MKRFSRRAMLATAGTLAAGTVAAVTVARKPATPHIYTLVSGAAPEVGGVVLSPFSTIIATDPPIAPAAASLIDEAGLAHTMAEFVGKGLVINMWATWCVPCVAEMPALQTLAGKIASAGVLVLPMSSDRGGAAVVRKFYAAHNITGLPVWLDPKGAAAQAWGARGLPTTYIIDRKGLLRGKLEGGVDWASDATVAAIVKLVAS